MSTKTQIVKTKSERGGIVVLDFGPDICYLAGHNHFIFRRNEKLLFDICLFAVGLNKIEFGTNHLPVTLSTVYEQFIKNRLAPIVTSIGKLFRRPLYFRKCIFNIAGFIIHHIYLLTVKL